MEQKQEVGVRAGQKKAWKKIDKNLLDQPKYNNHNSNKSKDSQFNVEANSDEIKELNISYNYYTLSCRIPNLSPVINFLECSHPISGRMGLIITFLNIKRSLKKIH